MKKNIKLSERKTYPEKKKIVNGKWITVMKYSDDGIKLFDETNSN